MASSQFLLRQVCCPKGSHWQLGLIYEYRAHHQCSASMGLALFDQQILYNSLSLVLGGVKKMARYVNVGKSFAKNYADLIVGC